MHMAQKVKNISQYSCAFYRTLLSDYSCSSMEYAVHENHRHMNFFSYGKIIRILAESCVLYYIVIVFMIITAQQIQYNEIHVKNYLYMQVKTIYLKSYTCQYWIFYIATVSNAHDIITKFVPFLLTIIKLFKFLLNYTIVILYHHPLAIHLVVFKSEFYNTTLYMCKAWRQGNFTFVIYSWGNIP